MPAGMQQTSSVFQDTAIKISCKGQRHLKAVWGYFKEFKDQDIWPMGKKYLYKNFWDFILAWSIQKWLVQRGGRCGCKCPSPQVNVPYYFPLNSQNWPFTFQKWRFISQKWDIVFQHCPLVFQKCLVGVFFQEC